MSNDFSTDSEASPFKLSYIQSEVNNIENNVREFYDAVSSAFNSGKTDENSLTNMIFFSKHPELDKNYKIQPHQIALKNEWLDYRKIIRVILEDLRKKTYPAPKGGSTYKPTGITHEPMGLPTNNPVEFASEPTGAVYWPVITNDRDSEVVSYRFGPNVRDVVRGRNTGREFYAMRSNKDIGVRYHAAIDLFANAGDPVIACQDGILLYPIHKFLGNTSALYLEHPAENPNLIVVYGEIKPKSWEKYNLKIGSRVKAGQIIGEVGITPGGSSMLHFETWDVRLKNIKYPLSQSFRSWKKDGNPPQYVLNPTKYLLYLKNHGIKLKPNNKPLDYSSSESYESISSNEPLLSSESLFSKIGEYVNAAQFYATISSAFLGGNTDENSLTDMIFFSKHPELDKNYKIQPHQIALKNEWLNYRNNIVRPIIEKVKQIKSSMPTAPTESPISIALPLLLSGPIVRRATIDSIYFWVALSEEITDIIPRIVQYDSQGQVLNQIPAHSESVNVVKLGKRIWVALCKVVPEGAWFPTDSILGYDLNLITEGPASSNTRLLSELNLQDSLGLNYPPFDLPTLLIGKANTVIAHGSCRRPSSEDDGFPDSRDDAFGVLDDWMSEKASMQYERPPSNIQTGDQIYADGPMPIELFDALENLSMDVFGYAEKINISRVMGSTELVSSKEILARPRPNQRWSQRKLMTHYSTSLFGFSTDDGDAHLISFPEYVAMYLMVWSPELWRRYYKGGNSAPSLINYERYVRACRRVMANCATYFVFDDHDVTDDWNLDELWQTKTKSAPASRQIISNALMAYLFFQGWGNDPDMFEKDFIKSVSDHLNNLQRNNGDPRAGWGDESPVYETILSRRHWSFMAASNPKALCVDTRTLREFPTSLPPPDTQERAYDGEYKRMALNFAAFLKYSATRKAEGHSAILLGRKVMEKLSNILKKENFRQNDVLLIVLPTPFIGHPFHIIAQEIVYPYPSARYPGDYEFFDDNPSQRASFIFWLKETFNPSALVCFSGDVHYGSVIYSGYVCAKTGNDAITNNYRWKLPVIQITSSPIKNIKSALVKAVSSGGDRASIITEGLAPEARARFNVDATGLFIGAGFNTAKLSGDLGKDTLVHRNNFCIVTMPTKPEYKVKSVFIGPKDGRMAKAETSINVYDDKFMIPIRQMVTDAPFKNKLKVVTTAIKLGLAIL
jgi:murein DD-endopeptidase MepM/ murein hydrolase activator NlpD